MAVVRAHLLNIMNPARILEITNNKSQITNKSQSPKFKNPNRYKQQFASMRINTFGHWILEFVIYL